MTPEDEHDLGERKLAVLEEWLDEAVTQAERSRRVRMLNSDEVARLAARMPES